MRYRKKYTKEQAKDKIEKLNIPLNIEEEFLLTFKPSNDITTLIFNNEGGYEAHNKKIKSILEEREYVKQFLKEKRLDI